MFLCKKNNKDKYSNEKQQLFLLNKYIQPMRRKTYIALSAILMLLGSCSKEMEEPNAPPGSNSVAAESANVIELTSDEMAVLRTMNHNSPKISQDEAMRIAADVLGKNSLSKTTSNFKCDVVTRKASPLSKSVSNEADTLMYVLNYGNNEGYAVVCADSRVPNNVLAFSQTGNMDTETDNPGVRLFMFMAEDYMDASIFKIEAERDSLELVLKEKFGKFSNYSQTHLSKSRTMVGSNSIPYYQTSSKIVTQITPFYLSTYWGQYAPYNNNTPLINGVHCPTGCDAVAVSQLMAYWKYPSSINGTNMQWNYLNSGTKQIQEGKEDTSQLYCSQVAMLVSYVGQGINTNYALDGSSSNISNDVSFLSGLGYVTSGVSDYSESSINSSINSGRPVIIRGDRLTDAGEYVGHCWLIDRCITQTTTTTVTTLHIVTYRNDNTGELEYESWETTNTQRHNEYFYRCNWGWHGNHDGYYLSRVFDTGERWKLRESDYTMISAGDNVTNPRFYKFNLQIAKSIHIPNN